MQNDETEANRNIDENDGVKRRGVIRFRRSDTIQNPSDQAERADEIQQARQNEENHRRGRGIYRRKNERTETGGFQHLFILTETQIFQTERDRHDGNHKKHEKYFDKRHFFSPFVLVIVSISSPVRIE